ncbi:MAG: ankyrin repeat domain-containing protein, partial [Verrucomicrobiota bacterium]
CGRSVPLVEEKSANLAPELPANPAPKPKPVEPAAKVTRPKLPPKGTATIAKPPEISIWVAARNGNIEAVRLHLTAGADANIRDEGGWVPLHGASGSGHRETVELLLAKGAKVNGPAMSGKTALDYASRAGHKETADLLRRHGGKTRAELKAEVK